VENNNTENNVAKPATESTVNMPDIVPSSGTRMTIPESTSDFKDWLEGIKMVARLPGGMPDSPPRVRRLDLTSRQWLAPLEIPSDKKDAKQPDEVVAVLADERRTAVLTQQSVAGGHQDETCAGLAASCSIEAMAVR